MKRRTQRHPSGRESGLGRAGNGPGATGGYLLMELVIGAFLALMVVLFMGRILLVNAASLRAAADKAALQANVTEALEDIARSVRLSRYLTVPSSTRLFTFDRTGSVYHAYVWRSGILTQDNVPLVARRCTRFVVAPDIDTTSVQITVELTDRVGNRVAGKTRVAVRNRTFPY